MRRKQFLTFLMAGALSVSMISTAAYGAADSGEVLSASEEAVPALEEVVLEETPSEVPEEIPEEIPVETPTEAPVEIPAEAPVETPTEAPAETPVEVPQIETPLEEPAPAEEGVTPTPEETAFTIKIGESSYPSLAEAVAAVPENSTEAAQILITGSIELGASVTIPANKKVSVVAAAESTEISRAAGFTGSLFIVEGGELQLAGGVINGEDGTQTAAGSLGVDGSLDTGDAVEGSVVEVKSGYFVLSAGVSIANNYTSENGGAVRNTGGTVILMGGSISKNQTDKEGGAVYSEGPVAIQGTVAVNENLKTSGLKANNIALNGENAVITVTDLLTASSVGVSVVDPADGKQVVQLGENVNGVTMADVLAQITYEGDDAFTIDENGKLKAAEISVTPTPTVVPLKVKPVSMAWTGYDSIKLVGNANKSGTYYVHWVPKGSAAPTIDISKKDGTVVADNNFTAYVTDLPDEKVDIYVCVIDEAGNYQAVLYQPEYKDRPAAPVTPTPEHVPVVPAVTESVVRGLENPLEFYPNTFYEFTVIGAGTQNTTPGTGDVRWVPQYWSMSSNPSESDKHTTWKIGAAAGIRDAKTYNIYIFYQKQVYDGNQWQGTDTVESVPYQFRSAAITITSATPTPTIEGQYDGSGSGSGDYYATETPAADNSDEAAGTTRSAVATADESPIGSMMTLAMASLLAGGYVLVRRRKKEI